MLKEPFQGRPNSHNDSSLNPYFNGTCSKSQEGEYANKYLKFGLNPYFNGTCSKSFLFNAFCSILSMS